MKRLITQTCRAVLTRKALYQFNRFLFRMSLHGLGIQNWENDKLSGEDFFLRRLAKDWNNMALNGPLILDVGAHIGDYSNKVKMLCPDAIIYAFEPHPRTFVRLQLEASRRNYAAINAGCSDKENRSQLYDYKVDRGGSLHASLYSKVIEEFHRAETQSYDVDLVTIDDFVSANAIQKIHLLKIDTEGNELNVIRGARSSIAANLIDIIQFELNEMNVVSRCFFRDFYEFLPNYRFYRMVPDGLLPLGSYNALMWELFAYQNIVAIRADCEERFSQSR
jgi:FkbM family methyltransferase